MSLDTRIYGELDSKMQLQADADDISYRLSCGLALLALAQTSMECDERKASEYGDAIYGVYDYLCLLNEELGSAVENECRKVAKL